MTHLCACNVCSGAGDAQDANSQNLMYDPDVVAPAQRYSPLDFEPIARVYHSALCLDKSGGLLVAGCETCGPWQNLVSRLPAALPGSVSKGVRVARPVLLQKSLFRARNPIRR